MTTAEEANREKRDESIGVIRKADEVKPITKSMSIDLSKIKILAFPETQYYKEEHTKTQVCLHHTASGRGVDGDYKTWLNDTVRIATCVIIDVDGTINQCFSSAYWGYHLGLKTDTFKKLGIPYKPLDKTTIGIEIDAWGALTKKEDGNWYSYTGKLVPKENVEEYPNGFKGFYGYEKYTPAQIQATEDLLIHWHKTYNIPLDYNTDMWNVSKNALSGQAGVWTHVSFREGNEKSDCHPQKELMEMLMNLHRAVR